ncbi:MAG: DUF1700 domain-containing protein [Lachnospiraceae bacterium]|nr:DUF1700 domain-containing protein [Lachnospiraceae bacterium]
MNKKEFLKELEKRLLYIPKEDREDALGYYEEYIEDMGLGEDDDVISKLGTPKDVSREIIDQCTQKHAEKVKESKGVKGKFTVVWLTILGFLSLPISVPLAIAVLAFVIGIVVAIGAILFSLFISSIACIISGIAGFFWGIFVTGISQKIFTMGVGLLLIGVGVLLGTLILWLFRGISNLVFRRKVKKSEE